MKFSVKQIAELLNGTIEGNADAELFNISKIEEGKTGTLSFLANPKYTKYIYNTKSTAVLVNYDFKAERPINTTLIRVEDAYKAFARLLEIYTGYKNSVESKISDKAYISESATIEDDVYIAPFVYVGDNSVIKKGAKIYPNTYIGNSCLVDENSVIYSGVNVYSDTKIGKNCIIHSGVVLGSDGFGFAPQNDNEFQKIPQAGNVEIKDNVEIGANTTIDRATIGSTIIHSGVKLDNLIQVAHNVEIGENTVIASQTGVSGSTKIGKNCMFGGQVGFAGHLKIADNTKIGAQSGVHKNVEKEGIVLQGTPVTEMRNFYRSAIVYNKLPEFKKIIDDLTKKVQILEEKQLNKK